jgi:hypothetical protein
LRRVQRLRRAEEADRRRGLREVARRLAEAYKRDPEDVLRKLLETGERIARWGLDAELRRLANEHGINEDEVRARYERALDGWQDPDA